MNLVSQLTKGQKMVVSGKDICIFDVDGKTIAEYRIGPLGEIWPQGQLESKPPAGCCRIVNFYYDPAISKVVVEIDNVPQC